MTICISMLPSKQQSPQSGQSRSGTPTDQQVEWRPRHWSAVRGVAGGHAVAEAGGCLGALLLGCHHQVCPLCSAGLDARCLGSK